ncbi:MAG: BsaA family SipW-dependent biofilm matrix protein [Paraclostridium bifermentans]
MNKKVQVLAVSGVLTVGVIGGTLAWFTSQDKATNTFNTASNKDNNGSGIKIVEEFEKPTNMLPGDSVNKDVQVSNTATYDQFIRVKFVPRFVELGKDSDGKEVRTSITERKASDGTMHQLDTTKIILNFTENLKTDGSNGSWIKGNDGYYYYMGKVAPEKWTNTLLDSVTLDKNSGNDYIGLGFDIDVEADSTQASNDAHKDWAKDSGLIEKLDKLQAQGVVNPRGAIEKNQK